MLTKIQVSSGVSKGPYLLLACVEAQRLLHFEGLTVEIIALSRSRGNKGGRAYAFLSRFPS